MDLASISVNDADCHRWGIGCVAEASVDDLTNVFRFEGGIEGPALP